MIGQIRRELRGNLPDQWVGEVATILEDQLTYQTLDELDTDDLLKLRIGAEKSPTLHECLNRITQQIQNFQFPSEPDPRSPNPPNYPHTPPDFQGGNWGRFLPWNTD